MIAMRTGLLIEMPDRAAGRKQPPVWQELMKLLHQVCRAARPQALEALLASEGDAYPAHSPQSLAIRRAGASFQVVHIMRSSCQPAEDPLLFSAVPAQTGAQLCGSDVLSMWAHVPQLYAFAAGHACAQQPLKRASAGSADGSRELASRSTAPAGSNDEGAEHEEEDEGSEDEASGTGTSSSSSSSEDDEADNAETEEQRSGCTPQPVPCSPWP